MNILNKLWPWREFARLRLEVEELKSHLDIERKSHALTQARHQETSEELAKHKEAIQQKEGHIRKMVDIIALKGGFLKKSSVLGVLFFCLAAFGQGTQRQLFTTNPPPLLSVTAGPMVTTNGGYPELTYNAGSLTNINTNGWSANAFNWVLSLASTGSANATNNDANSTNFALLIGSRGTNNTTQATNDLWTLVSASTNTIAGYARLLGANDTNNATAVSNGVVAHTVTVAGTANQITSSVGTAQQIANNPATTLSLPSPTIFPGQTSVTGITNASGNSNSVAIYDAKTNLIYLPTGTGALTNNGSGLMGWAAAANPPKILSFCGGNAGSMNVGGGNTRYWSVPGSTAGTISEAQEQCLFPSGTLTNLYVRTTNLGLSTNINVTIMTNGVASSLNLTIIGTASTSVNAADTTHSDTIPDQCAISIRINGNNPSSGSATLAIYWVFQLIQ